MTDNGSQEASWSSNSGTSTMTVDEAITHLPVVRPEVVAAQVHGPSAYVMLVRLDGSDLFVENNNGNNVGTLDANYSLGTAFTVQIIVSNGYIQVLYNGSQKADFASSGSGDYFKAGCYTQSNPSDGDSPSAYGQVIIYSLQVSHT
jgi:poly(beta-D-mannuronate) lyase